MVQIGNAVDLEAPEELDKDQTKCFDEADEFWSLDLDKNEASRLFIRPSLKR